jgi:hypothetical protein
MSKAKQIDKSFNDKIFGNPHIDKKDFISSKATITITTINSINVNPFFRVISRTGSPFTVGNTI